MARRQVGITAQLDAVSNHAMPPNRTRFWLLDESGQVEARYKYTAFGQVQSVSVEEGAWSALNTEAWMTLSAGQWSVLSASDWSLLPVQLSTNMLAGGKKQYYLDPETELYLLGSGSTSRARSASMSCRSRSGCLGR
jgi:hypothetical protein